MVVRDTKSANIIIIIIFCKYNRSVLQFIKYINGYSFFFYYYYYCVCYLFTGSPLELQLPWTIADNKATSPRAVGLNYFSRRMSVEDTAVLQWPLPERFKNAGRRSQTLWRQLSFLSCLVLTGQPGLQMWFTVAGSKKAGFKMGGSGSANRGVSFSLDEDEKVTVIEGVKVQC